MKPYYDAKKLFFINHGSAYLFSLQDTFRRVSSDLQIVFWQSSFEKKNIALSTLSQLESIMRILSIHFPELAYFDLAQVLYKTLLFMYTV